MAHLNIKARREEVAHLLRYGVRFEPPVIAALSREFSRTATAIRRDIRVVKSDTDLRNRLAHYWRPSAGLETHRTSQ
jgi:hypothetical protein